MIPSTVFHHGKRNLSRSGSYETCRPAAGPRRLPKHQITIDIGMILLKVIPIFVRSTPLGIAIQAQKRLVFLSAMSIKALLLCIFCAATARESRSFMNISSRLDQSNDSTSPFFLDFWYCWRGSCGPPLPLPTGGGMLIGPEAGKWCAVHSGGEVFEGETKGKPVTGSSASPLSLMP